MKHKLSKLTSLFLAVAMALAMAFTAVPAKASTTQKLTINNTGKTEHTFEIYQIFTGDVSDLTTNGSGKLSNVAWGNGVTDTAKAALGDASTKVGTITTEAQAAAFAKTLSETTGYLQNPTEKVVAANSNVELDVTSGYYLIVDKAESQDNKTDGAYTSYMLQVVGDTTVNTKLDTPTVEKKVKDTDDSTGSTTDWQDSADYDIGDTIPYKLTGTLPSNYASYDEYKYAFNDTMTHLTYVDGSVKVYAIADGNVSDSVLTDANLVDSSKYNFNWDPATKKLTVSFTDLKEAVSGLTSASKIVVTYKATLDEGAAIGSTGNPNEVTLTYSNNPNNGGEGTNTTKPDKNIVFTYETDVNKIDQNGADLNGAGFTLYKKYATVPTGKTAVDTITYDNGSKTYDKGSDNYVLVKEIAADDINHSFGFEGLDDGEYLLVETTTPTGYNSIDPISFKITATHGNDTDGENALKLISLTTDNDNFKPSKDGGTIKFDKVGDKTVGSGTVTSYVENQSGSTLPSTGGIGTTIFYVVGGILVAGAAILLITRRRTER